MNSSKIIPPDARPARRLPGLRQALQRIHLLIIIATLLISGISISAISLTTLRGYADNNLQLAATVVSERVRGALALHDTRKAQEMLGMVALGGEIASAEIVDVQGHQLAHWQRAPSAPLGTFDRHIARWLFPRPLMASVIDRDKEIGQVWIHGDATPVLGWLRMAFYCVLGSLLLTAALAAWLSHRMQRGILRGLQNITDVVQYVRRHRAFAQRVPASEIAELNKLSDDVNSLMAELDRWNKTMHQENASLTHQATHDPLTGLPNRTAFLRQLDERFNQPLLRRKLAVLYIDSDRFKQVNDRFGHAAGDAVLQATAARLRQRLRQGDIVARLGGDEFAVILHDVHCIEDAGEVAQQLNEVMQAPMTLPQGMQLVQSISIGAAMACQFSSAAALLAQADAAMYHIKETGGGWYVSPDCWLSAERTRQTA